MQNGTEATTKIGRTMEFVYLETFGFSQYQYVYGFSLMIGACINFC
jgi:hypothetical protein